jgi:hypothetical protein
MNSDRDQLVKEIFAKTKPDLSRIYPADPKQLPKELEGVVWPPTT